MSSLRRWRASSPDDADAEQLLSAMLTEQNAFVSRLPDGVTYRFHHMMKECAERSLRRRWPAETAAPILDSASARGMSTHEQYLHAMTSYRRSGDYDALLRVVQEDAGILLASVAARCMCCKRWRECPVSTLKRAPGWRCWC